MGPLGRSEPGRLPATGDRDLNARKVPFITLRGTLDERVARMSELLSRFSKYANVLEVLRDARGR